MRLERRAAELLAVCVQVQGEQFIRNAQEPENSAYYRKLRYSTMTHFCSNGLISIYNVCVVLLRAHCN